MAQKAYHSTAKTLLFMVLQKLRPYTEQLTHNDMPKLDYLFFETPCILEFKFVNQCENGFLVKLTLDGPDRKLRSILHMHVRQLNFAVTLIQVRSVWSETFHLISIAFISDSIRLLLVLRLG